MTLNPPVFATETDSPQRQLPDVLLLHGFGNRALPGDRVARLAMEKARLLGLSTGDWTAMETERPLLSGFGFRTEAFPLSGWAV